MDGAPPTLELDPVVEPVKPGVPADPGGVPTCAVPVVALLPAGGVPPATEPQGRPIASVRPVLFSELVVDGLFIGGLVLIVPGVDGVMPVVPGGEVVPGVEGGPAGTIADGVLVLPPMPVVPLAPAEPLLEPDDAPPAPPPAPAAITVLALPARRIAAINETAVRVCGIGCS